MLVWKPARSPYFGHLRLRERVAGRAKSSAPSSSARHFTDAKARRAHRGIGGTPLSASSLLLQRGQRLPGNLRQREVEGDIVQTSHGTIDRRRAFAAWPAPGRLGQTWGPYGALAAFGCARARTGGWPSEPPCGPAPRRGVLVPLRKRRSAWIRHLPEIASAHRSTPVREIMTAPHSGVGGDPGRRGQWQDHHRIASPRGIMISRIPNDFPPSAWWW